MNGNELYFNYEYTAGSFKVEGCVVHDIDMTKLTRVDLDKLIRQDVVANIKELGIIQ